MWLMRKLLAIKRLLEDAEYRATVIAMSSGEAPLDMNAIMVCAILSNLNCST